MKTALTITCLFFTTTFLFSQSDLSWKDAVKQADEKVVSGSYLEAADLYAHAYEEKDSKVFNAYQA